MNPWAIPPLIAFIFGICSGIYVLYINPKRNVNRWSSLCFFLIAIWMLICFPFYPFIGHTVFFEIGWFGAFFLAPTFLNLALIYPKKSKFARHATLRYSPYILTCIFYVLILTNRWHHLLYKSLIFTGNPAYPCIVEWGLLKPLWDVFGYLFMIPAIVLLVKSLFRIKSKTIRKGVSLWLIGVFLLCAGDVASTILMCIPLLPLFAVSAISIFAFSVVRYKFFITEPAAENEIETPQKHLLEKGLSYLVKEEKPDKGYEIFYDQVTHGYSGLVITKLPPDTVRERYKIAKSPIIWLTFKEVENAISPKDLEGLKSAILDFVIKAEKPVILLDCFDQLMLANGFEKSISMLMEIKDICGKNNANLLLSVNPEMFEKEQIGSIEEELKESL